MSNFPAYLEHEVNYCEECGERWLGDVDCPGRDCPTRHIGKSGTTHYEDYEADWNTPYSQAGIEWRQKRDRGEL